MSDIWAAAATALAADPNLGVEAVWTAREGGPPVAVRVIPASPEDRFGMPDAPGSAGIAESVVMPLTALPGRPARLDLLSLRGQGYVIAEVAQDARGASFTLRLRKA